MDSQDISLDELEWSGMGRELWMHMLLECPGACGRPECHSARKVVHHLLTCKVRRMHLVHADSMHVGKLGQNSMAAPCEGYAFILE